MAAANPIWGVPRIHGELLKLRFESAEASRKKGPGGTLSPPTKLETPSTSARSLHLFRFGSSADAILANDSGQQLLNTHSLKSSSKPKQSVPAEQPRTFIVSREDGQLHDEVRYLPARHFGVPANNRMTNRITATITFSIRERLCRHLMKESTDRCAGTFGERRLSCSRILYSRHNRPKAPLVQNRDLSGIASIMRCVFVYAIK